MMKKKLLLLCFLVILFKTSQSQTPSILWRFNTHDESFGNAAIADVDGDGKPEIVFSCYWGDSNIYVLNAEGGSLLWKRNMNGCNDAAPIIFDVDSDGHPEVILGSSCNPVLTCFNGADGSIKWQTPFGGTDSPPSIADIDGDGKAEILVGDFEGNLNCFTADSGHLKWQVVVNDSCAVEASPALVDVNGDGHPDIIVCTWCYSPHLDSAAVYAYDGRTHQLLWESTLPADAIYHGAAFADVTEDGHPDLAVSCYDGHVYLLNGLDGSLHWQYPTPTLEYIGDPVTIGDINNDGHLELVYSNGKGQVDALDRFGNLKWSFFMPLYESSFRGASLADINNDDTLDVIFASSNGALYALNGARGNLLWSINLRADYGDSLFELEHGPIIASFKQDDTLDIFVEGGHTDYPNIQNDFGRAYAIKVGIGHGPDWKMFQHDYMRSNCVCNPSPFTGLATINYSPLSVTSFPNPFSREIIFNLAVGYETNVSEIIYNSKGEAVKVFANGKLGPGNYQFTWDGRDDNGNDLAGGIYYCRISSATNQAVKKIVLIR